MPRAAVISVALYRLLLKVYPRDFHRRHATAMAGVFAEGCELASSPSALARWWIWSLRDLVLSASAEQAEHLLACLRRDRQVLAGSPGFGAALAALVTPSLGATAMLFSGRPPHGSPAELILLGAACTQALTFWTAAALAQVCAPRLPGFGRRGIAFLDRVTAFRRLASAVLRYQLLLTVLAAPRSLSAFTPLNAQLPVPPIAALFFVPGLSFFLVSLFFTLEPIAPSTRSLAVTRRP